MILRHMFQEKNEMSGDGGTFEATDGFDGSNYEAPTATETTEATDDIPF